MQGSIYRTIYKRLHYKHYNTIVLPLPKIWAKNPVERLSGMFRNGMLPNGGSSSDQYYIEERMLEYSNYRTDVRHVLPSLT